MSTATATPKAPTRADYALKHNETGKIMQKGDTLTDFRGNTEVFSMVSVMPGPNSTGKICVVWGDSMRELYPTVFGCTLVLKDNS
jgi:hypothetical protein